MKSANEAADSPSGRFLQSDESSVRVNNRVLLATNMSRDESHG